MTIYSLVIATPAHLYILFFHTRSSAFQRRKVHTDLSRLLRSELKEHRTILHSEVAPFEEREIDRLTILHDEVVGRAITSCQDVVLLNRQARAATRFGFGCRQLQDKGVQTMAREAMTTQLQRLQFTADTLRLCFIDDENVRGVFSHSEKNTLYYKQEGRTPRSVHALC